MTGKQTTEQSNELEWKKITQWKWRVVNNILMEHNSIRCRHLYSRQSSTIILKYHKGSGVILTSASSLPASLIILLSIKTTVLLLSKYAVTAPTKAQTVILPIDSPIVKSKSTYHPLTQPPCEMKSIPLMLWYRIGANYR